MNRELMRTTPAVYTAVYGGYDQLIEPVAQDIDVEWYCFTDNPLVESITWNVILDAPRYPDPRLSAKWPKMMPQVVLPHHRWSVWVDANLAIDSPAFVREALSYARTGLGVFRHPFRYSVCHEAFACLRRADCRVMPVVEQVRHYCSQGRCGRRGLYACGVLVRDSEVWSEWDLGSRWLEECRRWSARDQLSFPMLLSESGIEPDVFPFDIGRSPMWLALARTFGLTPGTFPRYLFTEPEARALCRCLWFPPLRTLPLDWTRGRPWPRWLGNPWFEVRPRQ